MTRKQDAQKASLLTRPAPARQDSPLRRRGRSERRGESYSALYVEPLSDARTPLADFFSILLAVISHDKRLEIELTVEAG